MEEFISLVSIMSSLDDMLFKQKGFGSVLLSWTGFNRVAAKSNVGELGSSTYTYLSSNSFKRNLATVEIPICVDI